MVSYGALRASDYRAQFFADNGVLIMRVREPGCCGLVPHDPVVSNGNVVVGAGNVSAGRYGTRTYCFDVRRVGPPRDWASRVMWEEPDGRLARVEVVTHDSQARAWADECRSRLGG